MKFLIGIIFCALTATSVLAQTSDYCAAKLCPYGMKHIACEHSGAFAYTCPANARIIDLQGEITNIVDLHNRWRNQIASGGLVGYLPAEKMATMRWDNELAYLAELNVRQCAMRHDPCRNTDRFKTSGQNVGYLSYNGPENGRTLRSILEARMNAWWNEYTRANMAYINIYPSSYFGPDIGHFTVMAAEKNVAVGCAVARWSTTYNTVLFACNYATTNVYNKPIYVSGQTASGCVTGRNPNYNNLCSLAEPYQL